MPQPKRNARGVRTEQALTSVAYDQVRRYGYDKTTIASVARAAGKPASSVYWMFGDKDQLITKALEASYPTRTLASQWELFDPDRGVREQLVENFTGLLTKTDRQDSVRTGVMLALEGAAADLPVQGPFWNRRKRSFKRFQEWWADALPASGEETARRLAALTMWALDGHYVGDRDDEGDQAAAKAEAVADLLLAAAQSEYADRAGARAGAEAAAGTGAGTGLAAVDVADAVDGVDAEVPQRHVDDADAELLAVTRGLVAAHGYEGATIARICEASGLKRSSVYWRHKDKDSLIKAAVAEQFLDVMGRLDDLPEPAQVGREGVAAVLGAEIAQLFVRAEADAALNKAGLLVAVQRFDPPTASGQTMIETTRDIVARLANWLVQALGPGEFGQGELGQSEMGQRELGQSELGLGESRAQILAWMFTRLRMGMLVGHVLDDHDIVVDEPMATDLFRVMLGRLADR